MRPEAADIVSFKPSNYRWTQAMPAQKEGENMTDAPNWDKEIQHLDLSDPAGLVDAYLIILMKPDPDSARRFVSPELSIRFTGNRPMTDPMDTTAFNKGRYAWVKKRFEATEVMSGGTLQYAVVYNRGTLYGEWPDGTPFENNRYVDRYVIRDGLITEMDVWNDSAEWLLVRAGLAEL
jgi:hypothetical protein